MRLRMMVIGLVTCLLSASYCYGEQVFWGIEYSHESVSGPNEIYILKVDLQAKGIRPFVTPELNGGKMRTSEFVSKYGLQVGVNTAFFNMDTNVVYGYYKSEGTPYKTYTADDNYPTMGFDQQNHYLTGVESRDAMYNACSGSDLLVQNGKVAPNSGSSYTTQRNPRTAVGIDKSGRYFYMVVVDGRADNYSIGMSLTTLAEKLIELGVYHAVNMDGGGSSTMVIAGRGMVNRPEGGDWERPVVAHLGFFANPACEPSVEVCNGYDDDCDGNVDNGGICEAEEDIMYQGMVLDPQDTDVDGDGAADICARGGAGIYCSLTSEGDLTAYQLRLELSNDSGWTDVSNYATLRFADVNGDGKADLCARDDSGVKCWLSNGSGFEGTTESIPMADADGYGDVQYYSTIRFADINGDGRDDMCARFKDGFKCHLSKDNGWGEAISLGDMTDEQVWGKPEHYSTIRTGDVNGDGKADVCGRDTAGYRCWPSEGDKFASGFVVAEWSNDNGWNQPQYYETIRMADINGDHKADICARDATGVICYLSNGASMGNPLRGPNYPDTLGWDEHDNYSTLRFGDLNGDGKDDFCIRGNAKLNCHISAGESFSDEYTIADMSNENGWNNPGQYRTIRLGDVNGDGKMDVCGRSTDGVKCYLFNGAGFDPVAGPPFKDDTGWGGVAHYSTLRIGGPIGKACSKISEICDGIDNNCNGEIDENGVCCTPSEEICDNQDNDCDGEIDEDGVCSSNHDSNPAKEICDGLDNDGDGKVDEDGACSSNQDSYPVKEICDGLDNDGDGVVDEDGVCTGNIGNDEDQNPKYRTSSESSCSMRLKANQSPAGGFVGFFILLSIVLLRMRRKR